MASADDGIPEKWQRTLTLKHNFNAITLDLAKHPEFFHKEKDYLLKGEEVVFEQNNYCPLDKEEISPLPNGVEIKENWSINTDELARYLEENVGTEWNKDPQNVRIYKNEEGIVQFEGIGIFGEKINSKKSAEIIKKAILNDISYITLSFEEIAPNVTVDDEELQKQGIKELVAIGGSDFSGSPGNRVHNIHTGANRFNGVFIPKGEVFSFNTNLGEVSARTGYRKELVIKGDKTVPDYGGGLCQVSTTAFRTALLSGLEIVERWPHAYAVNYYTPWGSDATIYLGGKDLKFKNDTPGAILMQTRIEGANLYFHFYGTKDNREVALFGPYTGRWRSALPTKVEYTDNLAPGERQILSGSHAGFDATWFQFVRNKGVDKTSEMKRFFSRFQPRGYFYLVGGSGEEG